MDTRVFSAYNLARGVLLNSRLAIADSGNQPLKLLEIVVSGMGMEPGTGLWLTPLHAVPAVPRVFPFDLIYLDKEYRVIETAEMAPGVEFPPFRSGIASALVLPSDILRNTGTAAGDRLVVCLARDLEALLQTGTDSARKFPLAQIEGKGPATAIIELIPEKTGQVPSSSGVVPEFEHLICNAGKLPAGADVFDRIEYVADAREATSPLKEPSGAGSFTPGPSMYITDVVFERPRQSSAPVTERPVDPEDLFSNWVVSPPPLYAGQSDREGRQVDAPASGQDRHCQTGEVTRPAALDLGVEDIGSPQEQTDGEAAERASTMTAERSGASTSKVKRTENGKSSVSSHGPIPVSNLAPLTTFTAVPYGMWQVSLPTALASAGTRSKVPSSHNSNERPAAIAGPNESFSKHSPSDHPEPTPEMPTVNKKIAAQDFMQVKASKLQNGNEGVPRSPSGMDHSEHKSAPKPSAVGPDLAEKHTPGDFVASLQEKLQRVQHSKLESAPSPLPNSRIQDAVPAPPLTQPLIGTSAPRPSPLTKSDEVTPSNFLNSTSADRLPVQRRTDAAVSSTSASQAQANRVKVEGSFRTRFRHWLNPISTPSDRRRTGRRYVPGMVAHYFTGGAPKPHEVADISMSGMYLLTDDRWMPGTMIQMTLQKPCARGERKQSINVLSRIVRRGSDGVAAEFVMSESLSRVSHDIQPSQATDKFALARFL